MPEPGLRPSRRIPSGRALLAAAALLVGVGAGARPASAAVQVTGAGSTFAEIAIRQWRADANRALGVDVNYNGIGSGSGRNNFQAGTIDWASSDVGFEADENPTRPFAYLPLVAGGTALMFNLKDTTGKRVDKVRMSGATIARIFLGVDGDTRITYWDDPAIAAENPELAGRLPHGEVRRVIRSAAKSGTTAVFTRYMASAAPDVYRKFASKYGGVPAESFSTWPDPLTGGYATLAGSSEIAGYISANTPAADGTIGYAEAGYAVQAGLPMVSVKNAAGRFAQPTARNVAVALTRAVPNADGTQNLDGVYAHTDPATYPISSYNYAIVPTTAFDPAKGDTLGRFLIYSITEGQRKAAALAYSPLPPNLVQQGLDVLKRVPGGPTPPPLGDWGRFYEDLEVEKEIVAPPGTETSPGASTSGGPGSGSGQAGSPSGGSGAGTSAGTSSAGSNAASAVVGAAGGAAGPGAGGPGRAGTANRATAGGGPGSTTGAPGVTGQPGGEAGPATDVGGAGAASPDEELALTLADAQPVGPVDVGSAWPLVLAAVVVLLAVFVPPLTRGRVPAVAGAFRRRRSQIIRPPNEERRTW